MNKSCFVWWKRSYCSTVTRSWWHPTVKRQWVYRRHKLEIDVVLLDVDLPKLTGWDVLLKMKEENPDVRVVIATGFLEPKMKIEMSRVTVKHFVDKPYM